MSEMTMRPDASGPAPANSPDSRPAAPVPKAEDEGLTVREIKWIPLIVPLAALTMLLGAAAALSMA